MGEWGRDGHRKMSYGTVIILVHLSDIRRGPLCWWLRMQGWIPYHDGAYRWGHPGLASDVRCGERTLEEESEDSASQGKRSKTLGSRKVLLRPHYGTEGGGEKTIPSRRASICRGSEIRTWMRCRNQKAARMAEMGWGWRAEYRGAQVRQGSYSKTAMEGTLNFIQAVSESHWRGLWSDLTFSKISLALV